MGANTLRAKENVHHTAVKGCKLEIKFCPILAQSGSYLPSLHVDTTAVTMVSCYTVTVLSPHFFMVNCYPFWLGEVAHTTYRKELHKGTCTRLQLPQLHVTITLNGTATRA